MACPAKGLEASAGGADTTLEAKSGSLPEQTAGLERALRQHCPRKGRRLRPKPGRPRKCRWRSHPALEGLTGGGRKLRAV